MTAEEGVTSWQQRITAMRSDWRPLAVQAVEALPEHWPDRMSKLRAEQAALVDGNQWRSGPRSLMESMGLAYRETRLTAGLAWLLQPDGHHGLGDALLLPLLSKVGLSEVDASNVRIVTEQSRDAGATRADLVLYGGDWTVCVEAKVFAAEGGKQLDRLYELWADDVDPRFVFLTRRRYKPVTAVDSHDKWRSLTWADVAKWLRHACSTTDGVAPGVRDYLTTLEVHHHG